jgi:hypothetical protein
MLKPRKPGDYPNVTKEQLSALYDYDTHFDEMDRELDLIGKLMAFAICLFIVMGAFAWGIFA